MDEKFAWLMIIPTAIILLLVLPIVIEGRVSFNPLYNRGVVALYIFKIRLFYFFFSFHGNAVKIENEKTLKMMQIDFSGESLKVIKDLTKELQQKIKLKSVYVLYNVGLGNAFETAMICGALNQIFMQTFVQIKNKKPTATLVLFDNVVYNKTEFELASRAKISISFWDLIYSFVYVVFRAKTHNKV